MTQDAAQAPDERARLRARIAALEEELQLTQDSVAEESQGREAWMSTATRLTKERDEAQARLAEVEQQHETTQVAYGEKCSQLRRVEQRLSQALADAAESAAEVDRLKQERDRWREHAAAEKESRLHFGQAMLDMRPVTDAAEAVRDEVSDEDMGELTPESAALVAAVDTLRRQRDETSRAEPAGALDALDRDTPPADSPDPAPSPERCSECKGAGVVTDSQACKGNLRPCPKCGGLAAFVAQLEQAGALRFGAAKSEQPIPDPPDPAPERTLVTGWWCPRCRRAVEPRCVTNDERHESCGCELTGPPPAPEPPGLRTAVERVLGELGTHGSAWGADWVACQGMASVLRAALAAEPAAAMQRIETLASQVLHLYDTLPDPPESEQQGGDDGE
jgi:chemotaxis protein histidine kinase CheA